MFILLFRDKCDIYIYVYANRSTNQTCIFQKTQVVVYVGIWVDQSELNQMYVPNRYKQFSYANQCL